jgi:hypothetical protein
VCTDELWYLRVDGWSYSGQYGEVVEYEMIASEEEINHVDCATDGNDTAFVVWSRSRYPSNIGNPRWRSAELHYQDSLWGTTFSSVRNLPNCGVASAQGAGIAYQSNVVAIATGSATDCTACVFTYDAPSGVRIRTMTTWQENTHTEYADIATASVSGWLESARGRQRHRGARLRAAAAMRWSICSVLTMRRSAGESEALASWRMTSRSSSCGSPGWPSSFRSRSRRSRSAKVAGSRSSEPQTGG